ncbi:MAG: hypothetical protein LBC85_03960 [Fibromonadaceae bacterium]|jgi:hypothetical protein|nr:hypothetical protein [Fibromonadaceae bacterium]
MRKSVVSQVRDLLKKQDLNPQFHEEHKKFAQEYQALIDKGLASKRESQLPSITEKMEILAKSFNQYSRYSMDFTKTLP